MSYITLTEGTNPEAYVMEGYDDCVIGISNKNTLVYSRKLIIHKLVENMSQDEAREWYEYNMVHALDYLGENAPVFCEEIDF